MRTLEITSKNMQLKNQKRKFEEQKANLALISAYMERREGLDQA